MIKLASNTIRAEHIDKLADWLKTYPKLTMGEYTLELEKQFAAKVNQKYSVFVNSGSSANLLMISALNYKYNHTYNYVNDYSIVVPALSWSTDLAPIIQLGFEPILVDCNLNDLGVDILQLEDAFKTHNPYAFLNVSILGFPNRLDEISELCKKYGVILIEDNCESLMTEGIGTSGVMSSYSTYYGHHISTIEGGFVTTDDREIYNWLLAMRSHGWTRNCSEEYKSYMKKLWQTDDFNENYTFYFSGYNFRNTEIGAYLGLLQLELLDDYAKIRNRNYNLWINEINKIAPSIWIPKDFSTFVSNFAIPIIHDKRDKIVEACINNQIECRPLVCGSMMKQPFYLDIGVAEDVEYPTPNADTVYKYGMYLPNHADISEKDIRFMAEVVRGAINE